MEEEEDEEEKKEEEGEEKVDWAEVRLLKIMYFLSGLTGSTWGRFAAIYFNKEKHLNSAQIGTIEFAMPMVKTVFQPIHGYIADIYSAKKEVYMCTGVVSTSLLMLLAFPEIARGYKEILVINVAISAFVAGGVLDAYTISVLKSESNVQKYYGRIRLWCAVSWGLGNIVMGLMTDYTENFTFNFILFGSMSTISLLLTFVAIPSQRHDLAKNKKQKENKQEKLSKLCRVLRKPFMIAFLLELFVLGCCVGVVERLLFVYLQNELHGNTTLCGLTVGVTVIIEFPMFHYNQKIAQRLGHHGMMMTALLAYSIRSFGYTLLTTETRYYILFLEALHGVTFALLWSAAVEYGKIHAPKDFNTTMQSIITTVYSALGVGIGSLVGGHIMDQYGGRWMYRGSSALSIIVFAIHAVVLFFSKCFGDNLGSTKEEEQQPTTTTTSSSIYSPLINDNNADTAIINDDD